MPKFAANLTTMFNEVRFLDRFAAARAQGFDAVEFQFPYAFPAAHIREQLDRCGLALAMHNLPPGDWDAGDRGMACDPARVAEFRDSLVPGIEYALALGAPQLHCMAGIIPAGVAPGLAHATYVGNLRHAAAALRPHGLRLLIEPINTWDVPGYFLTGSRQAAAIIAESGANNVFLQYDLYHMQRMEGELAATLAALLPLVGHIQIADSPGRHEPGSGDIDFPSLFKLLDRLGYGGWVGCEYTPAGDTAAGLGWRPAT
ncbi:MAG: 2-oxo-tetronate isomerase [Telluria sp.]